MQPIPAPQNCATIRRHGTTTYATTFFTEARCFSYPILRPRHQEIAIFMCRGRDFFFHSFCRLAVWVGCTTSPSPFTSRPPFFINVIAWLPYIVVMTLLRTLSLGQATNPISTMNFTSMKANHIKQHIWLGQQCTTTKIKIKIRTRALGALTVVSCVPLTAMNCIHGICIWNYKQVAWSDTTRTSFGADCKRPG